jgi:hypothetical protein
LALDTRAIAFLSAALRHVRDAEYLVDTTHSGYSIDQAYHLAGYGPECARKATLSLRWFDKIIGHQLGESAENLLDFIVSLDPWSGRYNPTNWGPRFPALVEWRETCRYEKTGQRTQAETEVVVKEARKVVDELVLALWMDGKISGGFE